MFSTAARAAPEWTIPGIPLWGERVTLSTLPSLLRDERLGRRRVGHQPGADDVELDHGAKALRRDRLGRAQELAAGVVDQHVEPPVALEHAVEQRARPPRRRGCPSPPPRRCPPSGLGLGDHLLERLGPPAAADHGRPEPRQLERRLAAEPGAGAGDDADLPVEQAGRKDSRALGAPSRRAGYPATRAARDEGPRRDEAARRAAARGPRGRDGRGRAAAHRDDDARRARSSRARAASRPLRMLGIGTPRSKLAGAPDPRLPDPPPRRPARSWSTPACTPRSPRSRPRTSAG